MLFYICNKFYSLSDDFFFSYFWIVVRNSNLYHSILSIGSNINSTGLLSIQLCTLSRQFVGTFIAPYAFVCRHIFPSDLQLRITFDEMIQSPKIDFIFHRTAATQSPIPFFPIFHPFGDRMNDKMWIRIDAQLWNANVKRQLNGFDGRLNFTAIICRRTNYWCRCISDRKAMKLN